MADENKKTEERWETIATIGDPKGSIGAVVTTKLGRPGYDGKRSPMYSTGLFRRGSLLCWLFSPELVQFQSCLHEAEVIIDTERMQKAKERNGR